MSRIRLFPLLAAALVVAAMLVGIGGPAGASAPSSNAVNGRLAKGAPPVSGVVELARLGLDRHDGQIDAQAADLRAAAIDAALTDGFGEGTEATPVLGTLRDVLATAPDWGLRPHNETSIAINPTNPLNVIVGMNDYHLSFGMTGYAVTHDGGRTWVKGMVPMTTLPITRTGRLANNGRVPDGGGDPVVDFARDGTAYFAHLHFTREDYLADGSRAPVGRNGLMVNRSTNGGRTWSKPQTASPGPSLGSPDPVGGVVVYESDPATGKLHDKEWMAVDKTTSPYSGRIYVTWTQFTFDPADNYNYIGSPIMMSYSSDRGVTWSAPKEINGQATFCDDNGEGVMQRCYANQFSTIAIGRDGTVYVSFENFNTVDENQLLVVKSSDGGATWAGPYRIDTVYDSSGYYLLTDGPTCPAGPSTRARLPNSCYRVMSAGNIAVDPVTSDLYVVWDDNRNGTRGVLKERFSIGTENPFTTDPVMDVDVFMSKSTDGGVTWSPAVRVNQDTLKNRKQQWFPWVAVSENGMIAVSYYDRRDDSGDKMTHRYMSVGTRGSLAFTDVKISSAASDLNNSFRGGLFMGDYDQIAMQGNYVYGSWVDTRYVSGTQRFSDIFVVTRAVGFGIPSTR